MSRAASGAPAAAAAAAGETMAGAPGRASGLCWIDGRILPLEEARISPLDRGFLFGDAVYETLRLEDGAPLFVERHLERLRSSLGAAEIPSPDLDLAAALRALAAAAGIGDGSLYLQVTRGVAPRGHFPPRDLVPTVLGIASAATLAPWAGRPMRAVTMVDPRWSRCDIKTTSLMGSVLGKLSARAAGCDEVLFVAPEDGADAGPGAVVREGGSTTFFAVDQGGTLRTHPLDGRVLPGVTRSRVLEAAREMGLAVREVPPRLGEASTWREAFLCGTLTGVQPLVELDGRRLARPEGSGVTRALAGILAEENRREARRERGRAERGAAGPEPG